MVAAMVNMIAALFVLQNGPYYNHPLIDPYDIDRDAKKYRGPYKVIAHPPCERWGRYWGGGPMLHGTKKQLLLGNDDGCFAHALWCVRTFGGVLEHPASSHAFRYYGLPIPQGPKTGESWTYEDRYGGQSCQVAQGHYGHRAEKLTWLYGVDIDFIHLRWGRKPGMTRIDEGFHSKEERARSSNKVRCKRLSKREREETPIEFRDLLISLVSGEKRRNEP